jgi:hypothetical protein
MDRKDCNKIKFIKKEFDEELKDDVYYYKYEFFSARRPLTEDDGGTYMGINDHDSLVAMNEEIFKWNLIKYAYELNLDVDEDLHKFMTKFSPDYDGTLEELKEGKYNIKNLK